MVRDEMRGALEALLGDARKLLELPNMRVEGFRIVATITTMKGVPIGTIQECAGWVEMTDAEIAAAPGAVYDEEPIPPVDPATQEQINTIFKIKG